MAHNASAPPTDPVPPVVVLAATKYLRAGQVVADRYEVRERLGVGGMGAVYRVFDRLLSEEVALKVLRLDPASDTRSLEPFRHETRLARKISHPNVCRVFDLGVASGIVFLTMELLPGETLRTRIVRNANPLSERLRLFEQTARGLAAVHARGILHRDLKPENVLVRADGTAVVADFGLALVSDESSASVTIAGTPLYMSPEQLRGEVLDARSDVFALGVLGYELLSGKRPFSDGSQSAIQEEPPLHPVIPGLDPKIANVLVDLLLLAIATDPANRWSSAAIMADAIAAVRATVVGEFATAGNVSRQRGAPPEMSMSTTGEASTVQRRWVAMHPTTGFYLIAVFAARLLDTATPVTPGAPADRRRSASADGSSRVTAVSPSELWRAEDFTDDFSWHQHVLQPPRHHITMLGARRLGGERIPRVAALAVDKRGYLYATGTITSVPSLYLTPLESIGEQANYIVQLSPAGAQQWVRQYNSSGSDQVSAMKIGVDGHLYVTGQFRGSVDFGGEIVSGRSSASNIDAYVVSYTKSGDCRWAHSFGDMGSDVAIDVALDVTNNVTVVGFLGDAVRFDRFRPHKEIFLSSMTYVEGRDESGELRWPIRRYHGGRVRAVAIGRDGNMYLVGSKLPKLVLDDEPLMTPNGTGGFVACLGSNGEHRWTRQLGEQGNNMIESIALDLEGNVYVAGSFRKPPSKVSSEEQFIKTRDAYVASFTALGEDRWSYGFGNKGDGADVAMVVSSSADILVAAVVTGTVTLNGTVFEAGPRKGTLMALFTSSGELRDAMLLQNCSISAIAVAPGTPSEAYAAGEFEGTIDLGADSITSIDGPNGILLKFAL